VTRGIDKHSQAIVTYLLYRSSQFHYYIEPVGSSSIIALTSHIVTRLGFIRFTWNFSNHRPIPSENICHLIKTLELDKFNHFWYGISLVHSTEKSAKVILASRQCCRMILYNSTKVWTKCAGCNTWKEFVQFVGKSKTGIFFFELDLHSRFSSVKSNEHGNIEWASSIWYVNVVRQSRVDVDWNSPTHYADDSHATTLNQSG
jgi:hypothetical protein